MKVELKWTTTNTEIEIVEIARVSSDRKNKKEKPVGLINYLIKNKHFSPFEMANMCLSIYTSRAIGRQILRHRSFSFQEFSQRYSESTEFENISIRKQAEENRQSSKEDFDKELWISNNNKSYYLSDLIKDHLDHLRDIYSKLIEEGVAKETARMILPECTQTHLYMNGTIRSWLSFLNVRLDEHAQKEIRDVALEIAKIFKEQFPIIAEATNDFNNYKGLFM